MNSVTDIRPSDKYIPWLFVLFFMIFIAVDAVMVTLAVRTQTGLVTEQAYEKGLAYNSTLQEAAEQKSWGWQDTINVHDGEITYTLKDERGISATGAIVTAHFIRPVKDGYDFSVPLAPYDNHYKATIAFPLKGEWGVRINVKWKNRNYQRYQVFVIP